MPKKEMGNSIHEDYINRIKELVDHIKELEIQLDNAMKSVRVVAEAKKNSKVDLIIRLRQANEAIDSLGSIIKIIREILSPDLTS